MPQNNQFRRSGPLVYASGGSITASDDSDFEVAKGTLYSVDATTGNPVWGFSAANGIVTAPIVVGGTVYASSTDSTLYAIDAEFGELLWRFSEPEDPLGPVTAVNGRLYFSTAGGGIFAVDRHSGERVWQQSVGSSGEKLPSVTVTDGMLYVSTGAPSVTALDADSGDEMWSDTDFQSRPEVLGTSDGVYAVASGGPLTALAPDTGTRQWSAGDFSGQDISLGATQDSLYITHDSGVTIADTEAETVRSLYESTTQIEASAVSDGILCISTGFVDKAQLSAVAVDSGEELWTFDPDPASRRLASPLSAITVYDSTVFVGTQRLARRSNLYALDIDSGEKEWTFTGFASSQGGDLTVAQNPSDGDSVDSRVLSGTDGHHHEWGVGNTKVDAPGTGDGESNKTDDSSRPSATSSERSRTESSGPGFGVISGATGIATYLLSEWFSSESDVEVAND